MNNLSLISVICLIELNTIDDVRKDILGFTDYVSGVFTIEYPNVKYKRCPTRPEQKTTWLNSA